MNASAADTSSPSKKRKLSSQDLPGPSTNKSNDGPVSEFYQSLLESSYQDDLDSMYTDKKKWLIQIKMTNFLFRLAPSQLSEQEMIQKALQMSRLEFMQSKAI